MVEDDGRIVYANEAYLESRGRGVAGRSARRRARFHRRARGVRGDLPPRAGRPRSSAPPARRSAWLPRSTARAISPGTASRVRPRAARRARRCATLWSVADVTHERERQENVFQELQHAIDYLDHAPAGLPLRRARRAGRLPERHARRLARLRPRPGRLGRARPVATSCRDNVVAMMTSVLGRRRATCAPKPSISICGGAAGSPCRCGSTTGRLRRRTAARALRAPSSSTARPGEDVDEGAARRRGPLRALLQQHADRHRHGRPRRQRRAHTTPPSCACSASCRAAATARRAARWRSSSPRATAPTSPRAIAAASDGRGDIAPIDLGARRAKAAARCASGSARSATPTATARARSSTRSTPPSSASSSSNSRRRRR